ncbi:MAG TPA: DUF3592 domain-containing protein [Thermomicrobiales bacterium]|nr:DUF3592 domain-containing protein [Thermomicrobiales bacterium]
MRAWPTVPGRIVESGYRAEHHYTGRGLQQGTRYALAIAYEYEVVEDYEGFGRRRRRGTRVDFARPDRPTAQAARAVADRYPVGAAVAVYYDPADPARAVLDPRDPDRARRLVAGVVMVFVAVRLVVGAAALR